MPYKLAGWSTIRWLRRAVFLLFLPSIAGASAITGGGGGGAGTPGGSSTQVQFNSGGSFAGNANFTTDGSSVTVSTMVVKGSGAGAAYLGEGVAPSGASSQDLLYGDSTAHALKEIPNNGTAGIVLIATTTSNAGNCAQFSADGQLIPSPNGACGTGGGGSGTVNSGTKSQVGYYAANGTAISGAANFTTDGSSVTMSTNVVTNSVVWGSATQAIKATIYASSWTFNGMQVTAISTPTLPNALNVSSSPSVNYGIRVDSSGIFSANTMNGAGLTTCGDGTHALNWTAGQFGCQALSGSGGGGSGTVNAANQFSLPYYSGPGSSTTVSGFPDATVSTNTGVSFSTMAVTVQTTLGSPTTGTTTIYGSTATYQNMAVVMISTTVLPYALYTASSSAGGNSVAISSSEEILLNNAAGTNGQVLTSAGPGMVPSWTTIAAGGVSSTSFTSNGTWTKPAKVTTCMVLLYGGGGGGGAGFGNSPTVNREGGSGGGGGARCLYTFGAYDLPASTSVIISTGGAGGSGVSLSTGGAGGVGGPTVFGSTLAICFGGGGGIGGQNATQNSGGGGGGSAGTGGMGANAAGSAGGQPENAVGQIGWGLGGGGGGVNSANGMGAENGGGSGGGVGTNNVSHNGGNPLGGGAGGGAGSDITSANVAGTSGNGGLAGPVFVFSGNGATSGGGQGAAGGSAGNTGSNGTNSSDPTGFGGPGGGGGGASTTTTGAAGGTGGWPGGGGGGGGAGDAAAGGAGGQGGAGAAWIWCW